MHGACPVPRRRSACRCKRRTIACSSPALVIVPSPRLRGEGRSVVPCKRLGEGDSPHAWLFRHAPHPHPLPVTNGEREPPSLWRVCSFRSRRNATPAAACRNSRTERSDAEIGDRLHQPLRLRLARDRRDQIDRLGLDLRRRHRIVGRAAHRLGVVARFPAIVELDLDDGLARGLRRPSAHGCQPARSYCAPPARRDRRCGRGRARWRRSRCRRRWSWRQGAARRCRKSRDC